MKKILLIGWKDLRLAFRDRAALILMLAAPLLLTIAMGLVTGSFSSSSNTISNIPVALVNSDNGQIGNALVDVFQSTDLENLFAITVLTDAGAARQLVDEDKAAAAVIIPKGFTDSILPSAATGQLGALVQLQLYANPTRSTSVGVIKSILDEFLTRVESARIGGEVAVSMMLSRSLIQPAQAAQVGSQIGMQQAISGSSALISINQSTTSGSSVQFNILAYMAPGMALMFLMYTVTNGGRALLYEKAHGTLPRMMVTPVTSQQVLAGKLLGVYLTGVLQELILITASTLLFKLNWGSPVNVVLVVLAAVFGAVGWGSLVTSLVKTSAQVSSLGSALMLIFAVLGGSFFSVEYMPSWFKVFSALTPNWWGISAFTGLARGDGLVEILPFLWPLIVMGLLLFGISAFLMRRRGVLVN